MLLRLRIAASVFFTIVAMSLCVLWARSYWWRDVFLVRWYDPYAVGVDSFPGSLVIGKVPNIYQRNSWLILDSSTFDRNNESNRLDHFLTGFAGFAAGQAGFARIVAVPFWFAVLLTAAIAVLLWLQVREVRPSTRC